MSTIRIGIVGAGVSGLACADRLAQSGIDAVLFDKGRRPGGRLSSFVLDDRSWDFGAQYFTARDPRFAERVALWREEGLVAPWSTGPQGALVGVPSMAALVEAQCARHDTRLAALVQRIERDSAGWRIYGPDLGEGAFAALAIAIPAEQAAPLLSLHDLQMASQAASVRSSPCWTVMVAFAGPVPGMPSYLRDRGAIAWASRGSTRPGRGPGESWVIQASGEWSQANLECEKEDVARRLLACLAQVTGFSLPDPAFVRAHRWRFALPYGQPGASLWNEELGLGACGDWCMGPSIEQAWLSGHELGNRIARALAPKARSPVSCSVNEPQEAG